MNNTKRLHIHATPLAVFAFAATLAVLTLGAASTASYNDDARQAFIRPLVKFAPTAFGLSSIQLNGPATKAELLQQAVAEAVQAQAANSASTSTQAQTPVLPGVDGLGHSAALQLSVN